MPAGQAPTERVSIALSRQAATALTHWLATVPITQVPVTDPSEMQALADLLTQLELGVGEPGQEALVEARKSLLEVAGQWVYEGATYNQQDPNC